MLSLKLTSLVSLIFSPLALAAKNTTSICDELSSHLPGKVSAPGNQLYSASVSSYYYIEQRQDPFCVVIPTSVEDVSVAVKVLAKSPSTTFAIRSGGHSPNVGASNTDKGVTINLQGLKSVVNHGNVTSIGTGAVWGDVYSTLDPKGLAVVGGRVYDIGVGGLTTGGGISAYSEEKGFACDNVANMQVVLASGEIVNANATSHPDLFIALKGGQNNFGIVTRFDLITFRHGNYWGGNIYYPEEADAAQLAAFTEFKNPDKFDPYAMLEQSFVYYNSTFLSANNLYYTKPVVNASALRPFTDIPAQLVNTMRISNSTSFAEELHEASPKNKYGVYATTTFAISPTILTKVHALWHSSSLRLASITGFQNVITFQPVPAQPQASLNSLGFAPDSAPEKNLVLALINPYWDLGSDSETVQKESQSLLKSIEDLAEQEGLAVSYKYLNYAAGFQDPLAGYGEETLQRMKNVSRKYDPKGVFQHQVKGGFKLFK